MAEQMRRSPVGLAVAGMHAAIAAIAQKRGNVDTNLIINRDVPPFDSPAVRQALALSIDRKAFNDIMNDGQGGVGGSMVPPPEGVWGMPDDVLHTVLGRGTDVAKNRQEGQAIMRSLCCGPDNMLKAKIFTGSINSLILLCS